MALRLRQFLERPGAVDYRALLEAVGRGICRLLARECDFLSQQAKRDLQAFKLLPIVPFGIPEFEVSFAAQNQNVQGGIEHTLVYPDLDTLGPEHRTLLEE